MAKRLCAMRRSRAQPQVIVLQEAFTRAAKEIPYEAGYSYVADGPQRTEVDDAGLAANASFVEHGHWTRGEGLGKAVDSGLLIASDYPILAVRRTAFPSAACAGFDCLANKGVVMVVVRDPASGQTIQIAATHLNSRHSAHVPEARSEQAYGWQVHAITDFLRRNRNPAAPLIFVGDFNTSSGRRRDMLFAAAAHMWAGNGAAPTDALSSCLAAAGGCGHDQRAMLAIRERGRDWQFYASGTRATINVSGVTVPFGREPNGATLSDHMGFAATYHIAPPVLARDRAMFRPSSPGSRYSRSST
jgi:endonuclease/exonuclease/phosphatase family metal-dependent hydrolase